MTCDNLMTSTAAWCAATGGTTRVPSAAVPAHRTSARTTTASSTTSAATATATCAGGSTVDDRDPVDVVAVQARVINELLDRCQMWRDVADIQHRAMSGVLGTARTPRHARWWRDAEIAYLEALNG